MAGLGISPASGETAGTGGNPYAIISERNVFHLTDPPPPPTKEAPKVEVQKVMFTGIYGKGDSRRALMAVLSKDNKELPTYLNLAPGERQKNVQLVTIRQNSEEIDIINDGTPMTLSAKSNSYASLSTPHPAGAGGAQMAQKLNGMQRPPPAALSSVAQMPVAHPAMPAAPPVQSGPIIVGAGDYDSQSIPRTSGPYVSGTTPNASGFGSGVIVNNNNGGVNMNGMNGVNGVNVGALFNAQTGQMQNQTQNPAAPQIPREVTAAILMAQAAAGGPPLPPSPMFQQMPVEK